MRIKTEIKSRWLAKSGKITLAIGVDLLARGLRGVAVPTSNRRSEGFAVISSHLPPTGPKFLTSLIHEVMHLQRPEATEEEIATDARQLAALIRKAGFKYVVSRTGNTETSGKNLSDERLNDLASQFDAKSWNEKD